AALRPALGSHGVPLFLAAAEPLASIFQIVSSSTNLVPAVIAGNPDRTPAAELAAAARQGLDQLYAREVATLRTIFDKQTEEYRTTDISDAARAAAYGAIDVLLVDIDAEVAGTFDELSGQIEITSGKSKETYDVLDAIAARALATGARVLGVREADIPREG